MNPILFLTQVLPLIVFIIIDSIVRDVRISILAAILFAIGQLIFTFVRIHQFDWFVLLAVALIAGLGAVSIIFKNGLFFKIKPAIIEGVTIIFMLVLILAKDQFLMGYFGRMLPGKVLRPEAISLMKSMLGWMCVYIAVHISAILYTAFHTSRKIWAIVSGPGFYLIFIPSMAVVLIKTIKQRMKTRQDPVLEYQKARTE